MKTIIRIIIGFALLLTGALGLSGLRVQAVAPTVALTSTPEVSVTPGVPFATTVTITGADKVVGFQLRLLYDADEFTLDGIQKAPTLPANIIYNIDVPGVILLNYTFIGAHLNGIVDLFTLTFTPKTLAIGKHDLLWEDTAYNNEITRFKDDLSDLEVVDPFVFAFNKVQSGVYGDVSGDGQVTILDVGMIQLHLADKIAFSADQLLLADVNGDKQLTIIDAGLIQMYLAGMREGLGPDGHEEPTLDLIASVYYLPDDTEVLVQGVVSYVSQTGFYIVDESGSIYVAANGNDISQLQVGDKIEVAGLSYLQNNLQQILSAEIKVLMPAFGFDYGFAPDANLPHLAATGPGNFEAYGSVYRTTGRLMLDEGAYYLIDDDSGAYLLISPKTVTATYLELAALVDEHLEVTLLLHDFDGFIWEVLLVPGMIDIITDVTEIFQFIVVFTEYFTYDVSFDGGSAAVYQTGNPNVLMVELPVGTEIFYVSWYFEGSAVTTFTRMVDQQADAIHLPGPGPDGTVDYVTRYASEWGTSLGALINSEYNVYLLDYLPDYSQTQTHPFGTILLFEPPYSADYEFLGLYLDPDFTIPATPVYVVTADLALYYLWELREDAITYNVYWHDEPSPSSPAIITTYGAGHLISPEMNSAKELSRKHGYWLEGWYRDPELTVPLADFTLSQDVHLYPKFVSATEKTIADLPEVREGYHASVYGTVFYIATVDTGQPLFVIINDGTGSLIVSHEYLIDGYVPKLGDELLVTGTLEPFFDATTYMLGVDLEITNLGTGYYDYSGATDILDDLYGVGLLNQKLYYIDGTIGVQMNSNGTARYFIQTTSGEVFYFHSQSTHILGEGGYVHPVAELVGATGRIAVVYAWYGDIVFAVPGTFVPAETETLIYQTIVIPWDFVDDYAITFEGGTYGIIPSSNPYVVFAEFPEGTSHFFVTFYLDGEVVGMEAPSVNLREDAIHFFGFNASGCGYVLIYAAEFGKSLDDLIYPSYLVVKHDYEPDNSLAEYYRFGQTVFLNSYTLENYDFLGVYKDQDFQRPAPAWMSVAQDLTFYYAWQIQAGALTYDVHWHHDTSIGGVVTTVTYGANYWISPALDTALAISNKHGYWFEGWYLDPELTQPAGGFSLAETIHLYPKLIPAADRTIADIFPLDHSQYPFVSVMGTVSYITMSGSDIVGFFLSDDSGSIMVTNFWAMDYLPELGDVLLVSGRSYTTSWGSVILHLDEMEVLGNGDGTYEYGELGDLLTAFNDDALVYLKPYYLYGAIQTETLPSGLLRYYVQTSGGAVFYIHSQSTFLDEDGEFVPALTGLAGQEGRLTVIYAWNGNIVYVVPETFVAATIEPLMINIINHTDWQDLFIYYYGFHANGDFFEVAPWPGVPLNLIDQDANLYGYAIHPDAVSFIINNGSYGGDNQTLDTFPNQAHDAYVLVYDEFGDLILVPITNDAQAATGFFDFTTASLSHQLALLSTLEAYVMAQQIAIPVHDGSLHILVGDRVELPLAAAMDYFGFAFPYATLTAPDPGTTDAYTFREGVSGGVFSLNPLMVSSPTDQMKRFWWMVSDGLYKYYANFDEDGGLYAIENAMAQTTAYVEEGFDELTGTPISRTFTITLKQGLHFYDQFGNILPTNHPLNHITATDFVATFKTIADGAAPNAGVRTKLIGMWIVNMWDYKESAADWSDVGITVDPLDEYTLTIELASPIGLHDFMMILADPAFAPIYMPYYNGGSYASSAATLAYTGPFHLQDSDPAALDLKLNPAHPEAFRFSLTGYQFLFGTNLHLAVDAGDLDATTINPMLAYEASTWSEFGMLYTLPGRSTVKLMVNTMDQARYDYHVSFGTLDPEWELKPILQSNAFRQALYFGLDRAALPYGYQSALGQISPAFVIDPVTGLLYRDSVHGEDVLLDYSPTTDGYDLGRAQQYYLEALGWLIAQGLLAPGEAHVIEIELAVYNTAGPMAIGAVIEAQYEAAFNNLPGYEHVTFDLVVVPLPFIDVLYNKAFVGCFDLAWIMIAYDVYDPYSVMGSFVETDNQMFSTWGFDPSVIDIMFEDMYWSYEALYQATRIGGVVLYQGSVVSDYVYQLLALS